MRYGGTARRADLVNPPSRGARMPFVHDAAVPFDITVEHQGSVATVAVVGELDLATAPRLSAVLGERGDAEVLVADLTATTFIDSTCACSSRPTAAAPDRRRGSWCWSTTGPCYASSCSASSIAGCPSSPAAPHGPLDLGSRGNKLGGTRVLVGPVAWARRGTRAVWSSLPASFHPAARLVPGTEARSEPGLPGRPVSQPRGRPERPLTRIDTAP